MRLTVATAVSCILLSSVTAADYAAAAVTQVTDIPPERLESALEHLARDRNLQLIYATADVGSRYSDGAVGTLSTGEALKRLLKGTGMSYQFLDEKTVTVRSANDDSGKADPRSEPRNRDSENGSPLEDLRLAQANSSGTLGATTVGSGNQSSSASSTGESRLEEIIVTAQKKSERLQDVPIPIGVLNTEQLASNNQVLLRDYASTVPGFMVTPNYVGTQSLSIRGITTGGITTPTVGVVIDDVPFGAIGNNNVPDIDPGDLERIEVLRGPQGTLYGADSMGGLMKFVTAEPSTAGYSGRVSTGLSDVYNGAQRGYQMRGSANIPVSDQFAFRVSGFTRQDPGFIDNPKLDINGVNESETDGGRLSTLWRASDSVSVKFSALYEKARWDGLSEADVPTALYQETVGLGDLQQTSIAPAGRGSRTIQAYSAIVKARFGAAEFTSLTGYNELKENNSLDFGFGFSSYIAAHYNGATGALYDDLGDSRKWYQEFRLSMPVGERFDWLVGAMYTHETTAATFNVQAVDTTTSRGLGLYYDSYATSPGTFREYAAFTNLTYRVTDRFDIQVGGRASHNTLDTGSSYTTGFYVQDFYPPPTTSIVGPPLSSSGSPVTYLVTPRLKLSPDIMAYARVATGYRPGAPNPPVPNLPAQSKADTTKNYEIGLKGDFLDHMLAVDTSIYRINWDDIQLSFIDPSHNVYGGNGSGAKSEGVELSVTAKPILGLTIAGWVSYDQAELTKPFTNATVVGSVGDRLPNAPKLSGNLSVDQAFPIAHDIKGDVGVSANYVGDRVGIFLGDATPRQTYPSYTKVDLHASATMDSWTLNAYVNNVADTRGWLDGGTGYFYPPARIYLTPRTVGINLTKVF